MVAPLSKLACFGHLRYWSYCDTFSNRGKKQDVEVQNLKEAVCVRENEEMFCLYVKSLFAIWEGVLLFQPNLLM